MEKTYYLYIPHLNLWQVDSVSYPRTAHTLFNMSDVFDDTKFASVRTSDIFLTDDSIHVSKYVPLLIDQSLIERMRMAQPVDVKRHLETIFKMWFPPVETKPDWDYILKNLGRGDAVPFL